MPAQNLAQPRRQLPSVSALKTSLHLRQSVARVEGRQRSRATVVHHNFLKFRRKKSYPMILYGGCKACRWLITLLSLFRLLNTYTMGMGMFLGRRNMRRTVDRVPTRSGKRTRDEEAGMNSAHRQRLQCLLRR